MHQLLSGLRAAGESSRLRLLFILSFGEFNVTELTQILGQSQPRVSRHLKLMSDAGLLERFKEGSWVLFRLRADGDAGALGAMIAKLLDRDDPVLRSDLSRLRQVIDARKQAADAYFTANAVNWDKIRSLHVSESKVETAMMEMAGDAKPAFYLDLGTGTGRILALLAGRAEQAAGLDTSLAMLSIARARVEAAGLKNTQVRQGDIYSLPYRDEVSDLITVHQVLHFLDDPGRALEEAARVLKPSGRLLIVDFSPHDLEFLREEHAHRRLGLSDEAVSIWLERAGLDLKEQRKLETDQGHDDHKLTVSLWHAQKPERRARAA